MLHGVVNSKRRATPGAAEDVGRERGAEVGGGAAGAVRAELEVRQREAEAEGGGDAESVRVHTGGRRRRGDGQPGARVTAAEREEAGVVSGGGVQGADALCPLRVEAGALGGKELARRVCHASREGREAVADLRREEVPRGQRVRAEWEESVGGKEGAEEVVAIDGEEGGKE
jgi:hypothetical protein